MRRRMLLEQEKYLVTFQDFVDAMVAVGCPTGTDSTGYYVDVRGTNVNGLHFFSGLFKPNTSYEMYIKAENKNVSYYRNIAVYFTHGSYWIAPAIDSELTKFMFTIPAHNTIDYLEGIYYHTSWKTYDFYIKEA